MPGASSMSERRAETVAGRLAAEKPATIFRTVRPGSASFRQNAAVEDLPHASLTGKSDGWRTDLLTGNDRKNRPTEPLEDRSTLGSPGDVVRFDAHGNLGQ